MRKLLLILLGVSLLTVASAQTLTAPTITVHWNAVTEDINNNSLAGVAVTYKVYGSQGCGAKTLQATTANTSATITVAPGCYSIAVSASDSEGEGSVSPTLTVTVVAATGIPAQVTGTSATQGSS